MYGPGDIVCSSVNAILGEFTTKQPSPIISNLHQPSTVVFCVCRKRMHPANLQVSISALHRLENQWGNCGNSIGPGSPWLRGNILAFPRWRVEGLDPGIKQFFGAKTSSFKKPLNENTDIAWHQNHWSVFFAWDWEIPPFFEGIHRDWIVGAGSPPQQQSPFSGFSLRDPNLNLQGGHWQTGCGVDR